MPTFTYNGGTILTDRDRLRVLLGDTNADDPLLYDGEIEACLSARTLLDSAGGTVTVNLPAAGADAAGAIAAKFSRSFSFAEDGQRFDIAQRVGHYQALERQLRNRSGGYAVSIGGTLTT